MSPFVEHFITQRFCSDDKSKRSTISETRRFLKCRVAEYLNNVNKIHGSLICQHPSGNLVYNLPDLPELTSSTSSFLFFFAVGVKYP